MLYYITNYDSLLKPSMIRVYLMAHSLLTKTNLTGSHMCFQHNQVHKSFEHVINSLNIILPALCISYQPLVPLEI